MNAIVVARLAQPIAEDELFSHTLSRISTRSSRITRVSSCRCLFRSTVSLSRESAEIAIHLHVFHFFDCCAKSCIHHVSVGDASSRLSLKSYVSIMHFHAFYMLI